MVQGLLMLIWMCCKKRRLTIGMSIQEDMCQILGKDCNVNKMTDKDSNNYQTISCLVRLLDENWALVGL